MSGFGDLARQAESDRERYEGRIYELRKALAEACEIALGADLSRDAVERIRELQRIA